MVLAIGAISGAHINPAVTFGLWSMRKLKTILVPFYWAAQFLGAMATVVLLGSLSGGSFAILFGHFMDFSWGIFALELIGTAIFLFGLGTVVSRSDLQTTGKAIGIGMSLMIGWYVALWSHTSKVQPLLITKRNNPARVTAKKLILSVTIHAKYTSVEQHSTQLSHWQVTEKTDSQLQGKPSRTKG